MNKLPDVLDENKMPVHVAFIIDGNVDGQKNVDCHVLWVTK